MERALEGRRAVWVIGASLIVVVLLAGEVTLRLTVPRPGFREFGGDDIPGLWSQHPTRGYGFTPSFTAVMATEDFVIEYRINELGMRDRPLADGRVLSRLRHCRRGSPSGARAPRVWSAGVSLRQ